MGVCCGTTRQVATCIADFAFVSVYSNVLTVEKDLRPIRLIHELARTMHISDSIPPYPPGVLPYYYYYV